MRYILALITAACVAGAAYAGNPPYEVLTYSPTLATDGPSDTRPTIAGTVVRVTAGEVDLAGGSRVPVTANVQLGQWATFVCDHIDTRGEVPVPDHCALRSAEFRKQANSSQLW